MLITRRVALMAFSMALTIQSSLPLAGWASEYRTVEVENAIGNLDSDADGDRAHGASKIGDMGAFAKDALPRLIETLQSDPAMSVRGEAAKAIGNMGPAASSAVPALIQFLSGTEGGYERTYAATALGGIGADPEHCIPALINALQSDGEPVVRELSARALGDFGKQGQASIPALIDAIKNGDEDLRSASCDALQNIPAAPRNVPALTELLSDEVDSVRAAAAKSLGGAGSEAAGSVPELVKLLSDPNSNVRYACAVSLGSIGKDAKSAIPALKLAAKDPAIQSVAKQAIINIKHSRTVEPKS